MKTRLLLLVVGGVLAAALSALSPIHSAPAPEMKPQRWEYKVVLVMTQVKPNDNSDLADKLTDQFNALAKDGWEYVGPVSSRISTQTFVAFRRPK